jgi:hypothetical protein
LITDEPRGTRRTLAVAVLPPAVAVMPRDSRDALPLVRLARLRADGTRLGTALAAAQAIDVDATGRKAFRALRAGIDEAVDMLPGSIARDERHGWILLQVTRLLFLRFVESEGWLDGRPDFLARAVDGCLAEGRAPERRFLAPLFHGTLNREPARRSALARSFGAIPFLNGGLFEAHPLERRRTWALPTPAWQRLFEILLETFEVTLERGDTGDRVSPELLGRVFEGVMHPDHRRASGTYFTPAALVPAVLHDALAVHLAHRLGRTEVAVAERLAAPDPELLGAMQQLRLLDPACGSGAFLVEALHLLAGPSPSTRTVRRLLTRRLCGVDLHPAAVRIAELRLWLELLRTMRGRPVERVAPLPNLDTSIRVGDALLDPFAGDRVPPRVLARLGRLGRAVATRHGGERRALLLRLRRAERLAARLANAGRIAHCRATLAELRLDRGSADLFGHRHRPAAGTHRALECLRADLGRLLAERRRLRLDDAAPTFGIESAFAPVLHRGGFDLVVGNPPWVRAERLPAVTRRRLGARYRWWRGAGAGWQHAPDLAVAFLERGVELLAPGGTLAFLVPSKLATAGYATRCRAGIVQRCTLDRLANLEGDPRADFAATTYPLALVATRRRAAPTHEIQLGLGDSAPRIALRELDGRATWPRDAPAMERLSARLAAFPRLDEALHPALGVKTGANDVYLDPDPELRAWTRPAIRGRDIAPLQAHSSARLLWPADARGHPLPRLPEALERHFQRSRQRLEGRRDWSGGPWWQLYRTGTATARWRVTWADLARRLAAAPLPDPEPVPLNSCYLLALRSEGLMFALAAWLTALPIRAIARRHAEPAANGYARFGARAVSGVPLPHGVLDDPLLQQLGRSPWSPHVEASLDAHAAQLLALSADDEDLLRAFDATGG